MYSQKARSLQYKKNDNMTFKYQRWSKKKREQKMEHKVPMDTVRRSGDASQQLIIDWLGPTVARVLAEE